MVAPRVSHTSRHHVAIVGAGALGSVFASALKGAGVHVTLLGRRPGPDITVCDPPCSVHETALPVETDASSIASADFVLLLVKTYDTTAAIQSIAPYLHPNAALVTLQNGLDNVARIRGHVPEMQRVLAGVTSQAARRVSPGLILHTGIGPTMLGFRTEDEREPAQQVADMLSNAGLPAAATGDIDRFIWQKVAINAAVNGLTAVAGVPNGALLSQPPLFAAACALVDEASSIASIHGYDLRGLHRTLRDTISATAENRSSMLQDVDAGRRTEVDAIYGSLIAAGRMNGLETPALSVIDALVRSVSGYTGDQEDQS
jgi:2-dehydropantoate 2-reductase